MQNLKMSGSLKHQAIETHPSFAASNLVLYNQLQVHSDGSPLLEWATMRPETAGATLRLEHSPCLSAGAASCRDW